MLLFLQWNLKWELKNIIHYYCISSSREEFWLKWQNIPIIGILSITPSSLAQVHAVNDVFKIEYIQSDPTNLFAYCSAHISYKIVHFLTVSGICFSVFIHSHPAIYFYKIHKKLSQACKELLNYFVFFYSRIGSNMNG